MLIGLTDNHRFRKTQGNVVGSRHGGNFRQSIFWLVPLGLQLIIICEYVEKPRRNILVPTRMAFFGLIKAPVEFPYYVRTIVSQLYLEVSGAQLYQTRNIKLVKLCGRC